MPVAAAVRLSYSPFRVRPHTFLPGNSAVHRDVDVRSASKAALFQCARSNAPNPEFDIGTQIFPDQIRYLFILQ
jgi:hypothetical protein